MKTKEELNALKEEAEAVNRKLHELTPEELEKVGGGIILSIVFKCPICGATKAKTIFSYGGEDVWCDNCNRAMDQMNPWL